MKYKIIIGGLVIIYMILMNNHVSYAQSQQQEIISKVESIFKEGVELQAQGEYRRALDKYQRAQKLIATPGLLYNMARCYEELKEYDQANEYYHKYLEMFKSINDKYPDDYNDVMNKIKTFTKKKEIGDIQPVPVQPVPTAESELKPGFHQHDRFFLRLTNGLGFIRADSTENRQKTSVYGASGIIDFAAGYSIMENLALTVDIFGGSCLATTIDEDGEKSTGIENQMSTGGIGLGLTYYFIPINIYVSVQIGAVSLQLNDGNETTETDLGFGLHTGIGKEWWTSANWGMGLAGQLFYMRISEQGGSPIWNTFGIGVVFSATYN